MLTAREAILLAGSCSSLLLLEVLLAFLPSSTLIVGLVITGFVGTISTSLSELLLQLLDFDRSLDICRLFNATGGAVTLSTELLELLDVDDLRLSVLSIIFGNEIS